MTYVVIHPHSNANATSRHVVVEYDTWLNALDAGRALRSSEVTPYDSAEEAHQAADAQNRVAAANDRAETYR